MRIGIDATALPSPLFGAGNYIAELIRALTHLDETNEYLVFTKPTHKSLFDSARAEIIPASLPSRIMRIGWEQTFLPLLVKRHRIDLLHSPHYTIPLVKFCPTVVTFHDMIFFLHPEMHLYYKRLFFRSIIPLSARIADAIVAASENTRSDIIKLMGVSGQKVHTIPYGISPIFHPVTDPEELCRARAKYELPEKYFIYVGNFEPRKNIPGLIRAFARLRPKDINCWLVLAGTRGWQDSAIFSTLEELNLADRVLLPGFISQADLPAIYSSSIALVYPSRYEGFGLPVLEAMACGAPVITSNISSMPEIVGDAGILIDPTDEDELADAMHRVSSNNGLRAQLAGTGINRAKSFSWDRAARETLSVYSNILSR